MAWCFLFGTSPRGYCYSASAAPLIVASSIDNGELVCDFKRATPVSERAALDFWRDENAPVGYLPSA